jgi:Sulfotransferase family
MKLPNFFVVGAPKAATTFIYACLDQHPQVYMSPLKEPHYFASELRPENFSEADRPRIVRQMRELQAYLRGDMREKRFGGLVTTWEDYVNLFANVSTQVAIGEASPCYLWSETAARNIASRVPHARIIINLRNPVDRAFSQYLHELTAGATHRSFRQEVEATLRAPHRKFGLERSLLEFGHYCEQIKRYQREFPRSQISISLYEDLERSPEAMVKDLFAFLGVDPDIPVDVSIRPNEARIPRLNSVAYVLKKWRLWAHLRNLLPQPLGPRLRSLLIRSRASLVMSPADRAFLIEYYRDEINNLAALLSHDLTAWLDPLMPHGNLTPDSMREFPMRVE